MIVQLRVIAGPDRGRTVPMELFPMRIGRGRESDTGLTDPYVSRAHCRLELRGSDLTLVDLGSSGGTYVNDRRVGEHGLRPGDVIRIGNTRLRLEEDLADQATLVPPGRQPPPSEPDEIPFAEPVLAPAPPPNQPARPVNPG